MTSKSVRHPVLMASAWMSVALVSFTITAVTAREASKQVSSVEILLFRNVVGLVILMPLLAWFGWRFTKTTHLRTHLERNVTNFGAQLGWVYGLSVLPIAQVFAIDFTTPLWTALLATLLINERLTRSRIAAVGLGIAGVLVILRPGFHQIHPAVFAVLIAAIGFGWAHTATKRLVGKESALTILFLMCVIQIVLGLVPTLYYWVTPSPWTFWLLVGAGASGLLAHYCIARALSLADAMVVVPLDFLRLPLAAVAGYLLYNEKPDGFLFLGAALMVGGNLLNVHIEHKRGRADVPEFVGQD